MLRHTRIKVPARTPPTAPRPLVSIVVPCRNEAEYIRPLLESVLANDYPQDRLEVLVVDGLSDDGTRAVVADYARRYPMIQVLDNPKRTTPHALNLGITRARVAIIMRMDAHAHYPPSYVADLVDWLERTGADYVGGAWVTLPAGFIRAGGAIRRGAGAGPGRGVQFPRGPCGWTHPAGTRRRLLLLRAALAAPAGPHVLSVRPLQTPRRAQDRKDNDPPSGRAGGVRAQRPAGRARGALGRRGAGAWRRHCGELPRLDRRVRARARVAPRGARCSCCRRGLPGAACLLRLWVPAGCLGAARAITRCV